MTQIYFYVDSADTSSNTAYGSGLDDRFLYYGGNDNYYGERGIDTLDLGAKDSGSVTISRDHLGIYVITTQIGSISLYQFEKIMFADATKDLLPPMADVYWYQDVNVPSSQYFIGGLNESELYVYSGGDHFFTGSQGYDILGLYLNSNQATVTKDHLGIYSVQTSNGTVKTVTSEEIAFQDKTISIDSGLASVYWLEGSGFNQSQYFIGGLNDSELYVYSGGDHFFTGSQGYDILGLYLNSNQATVTKDHLGIYSVQTSTGTVKTVTSEEIAFQDKTISIDSGLASVYWLEGSGFNQSQYFIGGLNDSELYVYSGGDHFFTGSQGYDILGLYLNSNQATVTKDHLGIYSVQTSTGTVKTVTSEEIAFQDKTISIDSGLASVYWLEGSGFNQSQYFIGGLNDSELYVYSGGDHFFYGSLGADTVGVYANSGDATVSKDHLAIYTIQTITGTIKTATTEQVVFQDKTVQLDPGLASVYWIEGYSGSPFQYYIGGLNDSELYVYSGGDHAFEGSLGTDSLGLYYTRSQTALTKDSQGFFWVTTPAGVIRLSNVEYIRYSDQTVDLTTNAGPATFRVNGNGTGQEVQALACMLDQLDPDGMIKLPPSKTGDSTDGYTYQWQLSSDGINWSNSNGTGATTFKYSVNLTSDANKFLRVRVGYTDDKGTVETVYTEQVKIISGTTKSDKFTGTAGVEVTFSGSGADAVATGAGNDFAKGGIGNDTFTGADGDGDDFFDGQTEIDIINYSASSKGVDIDFVTGLATERATGGIGKDSFAGIENARGTTGADSFKGSTGVNVFTGSGGADIFTLANAQAFGASTSDRITDMSSDDKIQVSASAFGIVGKTYSFAAVSGTKAVNAASALIVYDTGSGYVYLNKDGAASGLGGGGIFAVLDNKLVGLAAANVGLI